MRRVLFACALFALAVPAATSFAARGAEGDGTLVVRNASGVIHIAARGSVIGSCDHCTIWIDDPTPGDGSGPIVSGFDGKRDLTETKSRWSGSDVRFRLIGGFARTRVRGSGIDLYVVGRGSVTVQGWLTNVGTYAVDGAERRLLPFEPLSFQLGVKVDN